MTKSRWFIAFKETMFQLAFLHFIMLVIQAVLTQDIFLFNIVSILDLTFFMPNFRFTLLNTILLFLPILAMFLFNSLRAKQKDEDS